MMIDRKSVQAWRELDVARIVDQLIEARVGAAAYIRGSQFFPNAEAKRAAATAARAHAARARQAAIDGLMELFERSVGGG